MAISAVIFLDQIPEGSDRIRLMRRGKALEINLHRLFEVGKTTDTVPEQVLAFLDAVAGEDLTGEAARDRARELQGELWNTTRKEAQYDEIAKETHRIDQANRQLADIVERLQI